MKGKGGCFGKSPEEVILSYLNVMNWNSGNITTMQVANGWDLNNSPKS